MDKNDVSLRDYFAAAALPALLDSEKYHGIIGVNGYEHHMVEAAYTIADAMLIAREKEKS